MKILKIVLLIVAVVVALFLITAALAPKTFHVERKIVIHAPAEAVFSELNSFQKWALWSPWVLADSTIKNTYTGPEQGVGNKVSWTGKMGPGTQEIKESVESKYISTSLALGNFKPFEGRYTLVTVDSGTEVTWAANGSIGFPGNIFTLFLDKMMSPDFERALGNLKKQVESSPAWKLGEYKVEELEPSVILTVLDSCPAAEISKKLGGLYGEIGGVMGKNKLQFIGPVMAYYYSYSPEKVVLEAAVPVAKEIKGEGRVKGKTTAKTKVLGVTFHGDYQFIKQAMPVIVEYMKTNHLEQNGPELEVYMNDPTTVKNKIEIETKMYFPVK